MFRWYMDASRCYVYLSDVEATDRWEDSFRQSRWFTRGWTLQELLAPSQVHFFASDGTCLGDKSSGSLESIISTVTGISPAVLCGCPLAECTIEERMSWMKTRRTKRKEDRVYSLLGIFDVSMPVLYGEGEAKAMRRLEYEVGRS